MSKNDWFFERFGWTEDEPRLLTGRQTAAWALVVAVIFITLLVVFL